MLNLRHPLADACRRAAQMRDRPRPVAVAIRIGERQLCGIVQAGEQLVEPALPRCEQIAPGRAGERALKSPIGNDIKQPSGPEGRPRVSVGEPPRNASVADRRDHELPDGLPQPAFTLGIGRALVDRQPRQKLAHVVVHRSDRVSKLGDLS